MMKKWMSYLLLSVMLLTLSISAATAEAKVLDEKTGNTLYSGSDVPMLENKEFIVSVKVDKSDGDTIYYRYEVTDFDATKHSVYLEVFFSPSYWTSGPYPPFENRRDFHSGASHAGDIEIGDDEYKYFSFVWINDGSEKCTFDYMIGIKDSSTIDICSSSLVAGLVLLVLFVAAVRARGH